MIESIPDLVAYLKQYHHRCLEDYPEWVEGNFALEPSEIPADLPPGLALIYRELGALVEIQGDETPFAAQDGSVPVSRLKRIDDMVEFAWENQGNWSARFPLGSTDPPVYSNAADVWQHERRGFVIVCNSLNHFLTTLCLQEAVFSSPVVSSLDSDLNISEAFTIPLEPLWINGYYVDGAPDHHFYVSRERDVLIMDSAGSIWIGSLHRRPQDIVVPSV